MTGQIKNWQQRTAALLPLCAILLVGTIACEHGKAEKSTDMNATATKSSQDVELSRRAFLSAYTVLMHPRCLNCHPSGDAPLQGDDSHIHTQNVKRGPDGKGLYAMKCSSCHQDENRPGENMPPGNPNWHLPAADMPLVFQGLSPAQLATQLKDPSKNGGKTLEQLIHHVEEDSLVLTGWNPGDGRTLPPLSHEEFASAFRTWIEEGAAVPE
jgi:hypothetical protein